MDGEIEMIGKGGVRTAVVRAACYLLNVPFARTIVLVLEDFGGRTH